MQRLRLYDVRQSRLPRVVGICDGDIQGIADYTNTAQRRLIMAKEAGDEGWWGTWAEMAFTVSRDAPYLTVPREVARVELVNICNRPIPIQNQFYEYLQFGNGRMPKLRPFHCHRDAMQVYTRNSVPTFIDLNPGPSPLVPNPPIVPQFITAFASNAADLDGAHRVLYQGLDQNGMQVFSKDGINLVQGVFVPLAAPFSTTAPIQFTQITGIQKDLTSGPVQFIAVDPVTGNQTTILNMEPSETTAWYRRYYFDRLPFNCCQLFPPAQPSTPTTVQVTAIVKLDLIPVQVDADYCLIQNIEAITEEAGSVRYSEMDTPTAKQMSRDRHQAAIALLNGELTHFLGRDEPAVAFRPFGSARLDRVRVGMI